MKKLILIGHCTRVKELVENQYHFHFIGVYKGHYIKNVLVLSGERLKIYKDSEYILKIRYVSIKGNTLIADIINYKDLSRENLF